MSELLRDIMGEIRVTARSLALASDPTERICAEDLRVAIARLTAGDNPNEIDVQHPAFRAGAALALSAMLNAQYEQLPVREQ
jgi:hypothetical protein